MQGAKLLIKCLEEHKVERIYAIPGAKVDAIFNELVDSSIEIILCRHEQNAVFMAAAEGRLSGRPGVVLVTSGPGTTNIVTGLLTANTEGDPVVAIGGNAERKLLHHSSHQTADNISIMKSVTKFSQQIISANEIPSAVSNAFRDAMISPRGASFLSIPKDVTHEEADKSSSPTRAYLDEIILHASDDDISQLAERVKLAKLPVLFLGQDASRLENYKVINNLISCLKIPVVLTYQAAGCVSRENMPYFLGRVGIFDNQPGDKILHDSDLIINVGFNPVEYDPEIWCDNNKYLAYINFSKADIHFKYQPNIEILGNIKENVSQLLSKISTYNKIIDFGIYKQDFDDFCKSDYDVSDKDGKIHPLSFIKVLQNYIDDHSIISCDIGSHGLWMDRYFFVNHPHQMLVSNGQQTLGVGMPWAMAARLLDKKVNIFSISGDGGFLFSAMELETAVRYKLPFIHFIFNSSSYDMVKIQEIRSYGRSSGVDLGSYNIEQFASSFGAYGHHVSSSEELDSVINQALSENREVPTIIMFDANYDNNMDFFIHVKQESFK
jgi:acetolactate synthase-1/2/3 large subunit